MQRDEEKWLREEDAVPRAVIGRARWGRGWTVFQIPSTPDLLSPSDFQSKSRRKILKKSQRLRRRWRNNRLNFDLILDLWREKLNRDPKIPSTLCVIVFQFIRSQIETQKS